MNNFFNPRLIGITWFYVKNIKIHLQTLYTYIYIEYYIGDVWVSQNY